MDLDLFTTARAVTRRQSYLLGRFGCKYRDQKSEKQEPQFNPPLFADARVEIAGHEIVPCREALRDQLAEDWIEVREPISPTDCASTGAEQGPTRGIDGIYGIYIVMVSGVMGTLSR